MKKLCLIIVSFLTLSTCAYSHVVSSEMTSENFFHKEGFSPEVYRIVRFQTEPEKLEQEKNEAKSHIFTYNLKKFYRYLDPHADHGNFSVKEYGAKDDSMRKIISF